ncbi:major facilitator superfamily domain-containing protein [Trichoderma breve]|uniref:Major facilitator superfamily domain-containing protein n=1 Tax=Trichoderma breve TaxID=2034170 RepID=A0A9W9BB92_9HYPO|nr:major facilitator superfamily domain-containing protein [Trichoderma breve]KAJ4856768.1 major facilitator superfamily domain-containing protein [Trichoderma breve]
MMEDEETLEEGHSAISSEKRGTRKSNAAGELDDQILDVETQGRAMRDSSIEGPMKMSGSATEQGLPTRPPQNKAEEKPPSPIIPTSDLDKDIVGWEREDDPAMPLNFKNSQKWLIVCLLSMITFMSPFASSILAPAIIFIEKDLEVSSTTKGAMPVSIFLLGYAVGPLFLSPLSEIYGRNIVLLVSNLWFCLWLIGCALAPTLDTLIFFRFMTGIGGSACQTIGGAVIRGFVSETIGWRWVNWITFIPAAIIVLISTAINRETNHRVLIKRKTQKLRQELNRPQLRSCYDNPDTPFLPTWQILLDGFVRPMKMLFHSAIIFSISLYIAFAYGCLYLLFNTIPMVFQGSYGWSIGITGLVYLTMLIGYAVGLGIFAVLSDKTVVRMTKANHGVFEPEMRLADCIFFAFVLPISFFWYGWSADQAVHWIVPIIGIIPFGIAIVGIWLPAQAYIIDAYPQHSASGLAAFSVLRCIVAAFLPLAGPQMYKSLGVGWGTSLLGFIALALIPIPALIYKFGGRLRQRFPLTL